MNLFCAGLLFDTSAILYTNCIFLLLFLFPLPWKETKGYYRITRWLFVAINSIAERYRGGGHACASGATVFSKKEMRALVKEADAVVKHYKENNEGWL